MKILFGKVDPDFQYDEAFEDTDGTQFDFSLELGYHDDETQFAITDSLGRSIPFDYSDIDALFNAVIVAKHKLDALKHAERIQEDILSDEVFPV